MLDALDGLRQTICGLFLDGDFNGFAHPPGHLTAQVVIFKVDVLCSLVKYGIFGQADRAYVFPVDVDWEI
jgi:hypothetical protein